MKYQSIQVLRALAALMVVLFHSRIVFPHDERTGLLWIPGFTDYGDLGVSLFFVISGFIIAVVIDRPSFSVGSYFWRRFFRIYPLLWTVMISGLALYLTRGWFRWDVENQGQWGMLLSFLSFPQQHFPFWEPAWTLQHEVLFYVIAALVAPLVGLRGLAVVLIGLGVSGQFWNLGWDFHLTHYSQIYFGAGVAAYLLRNSRLSIAVPIAVAGIVIGYARVYGLLHLHGAMLYLPFAVGFGAILIVGTQLDLRGVRFPKFAVRLGDASYSLYLWHWIVIPIVATWRYDAGGGSVELWRWIFVACAIGLSVLSYEIIEKPIIAFSHQFGSKKKAPAAAPAE